MLNKEVRQNIHSQRGAVNMNSQTADKVQYYSRIKSEGTGGLVLIPELWVCLRFVCALQSGCSVIIANGVIPMTVVIPNRPNVSVVHQGLLAPLPSLLCSALFDLSGREDSYKSSLFRIQECEIFSSYNGKTCYSQGVPAANEYTQRGRRKRQKTGRPDKCHICSK